MPKINNIGESTPTLIAHPSREALASDATTRILDVIEHILTERTMAHVSLTGGTMGIATLRAWAQSPRVRILIGRAFISGSRMNALFLSVIRIGTMDKQLRRFSQI